MAHTFTWHSFDEEHPEDKDWVLIADDRFQTPVKALFKDDCGTGRLLHIGHADLDDATYLGEDWGEFEHAYAWTPLPPMPTREQMRNG